MAAHLFRVQVGFCNWRCRPFEETSGIDQHTSGIDVFHRRRLHLQRGVKQRPGHLCVVCSGSGDHQRRRRSKATKATRSLKSDQDLVRDLQQFCSAIGLPVDQAPSTKDLANHGRVDLANIVRRRGYKAVGELLANFDLISTDEGTGDKKSSKTLNALESQENESLPTHLQLSPNGAVHPVFFNNPDICIQDVEPKLDDSYFRRLSNDGLRSRVERVAIVSETVKEFSNSIFDGVEVTDKIFSGDSVQWSLQERAAEFVRTGRLNFGGESVVKEEDGTYEDIRGKNFEDPWEVHPAENLTAESIAVTKAAKLRSKLLHLFSPSDKPKQIQNDALLLNIAGKKNEVERLHKQEMAMQFSFGIETQREIDSIKLSLRYKEIEVTELSRELVEVKAQLALIKVKAMAELAQSKQFALDREIQLSAANQALADLKQVRIEYWCQGGCVELAGSFNGWHHRIAMRPDPSSEMPNPDGSKGIMMWGTKLWLYPGIYEIKFVVDENWQIDPRREVVMWNSHQNNILRVDA
eukprot:c17642_g1_i2 orf=557-2125(+)